MSESSREKVMLSQFIVVSRFLNPCNAYVELRSSVVLLFPLMPKARGMNVSILMGSSNVITQTPVSRLSSAATSCGDVLSWVASVAR